MDFYSSPFSVRSRIIKPIACVNYSSTRLRDYGGTKPTLNFLRAMRAHQSTSARPFIVPISPARERICLEVRDAHRNVELICARIARIQRVLTQPLAPWRAFSELPAFDPPLQWQQLSKKVREWLIELFPSQPPPGVESFPQVMVVYQTYHNFTYLLRDWQPWLQACGQMPLLPQVVQAQSCWRQFLERQADALPANRAVGQELIAELLVQVEASGLYQCFSRFDESHLPTA